MYINKISNKLGEIIYNKHGSKMTIIKYANSKNILVQFDNGYIVKSDYGNFKKGNIKSLYDKTVCDVGFIGEGNYKCWENNKNTKEYSVWGGMLLRCYNKKVQIKCPTYKNCSVCDEWHNFQNFGKWYNQNYYEIDEQKMCIDKDILHKGNKIYSPENCVIVPNDINELFTKRQNYRGEYPIGVYYAPDRDKFRACYAYKGTVNLGQFDNPIEAFNVYKIHKERIIKKIADEYKDRIPKKLYDAMYTYEVEITD